MEVEIPFQESAADQPGIRFVLYYNIVMCTQATGVDVTEIYFFFLIVHKDCFFCGCFFFFSGQGNLPDVPEVQIVPQEAAAAPFQEYTAPYKFEIRFVLQYNIVM